MTVSAVLPFPPRLEERRGGQIESALASLGSVVWGRIFELMPVESITQFALISKATYSIASGAFEETSYPLMKKKLAEISTGGKPLVGASLPTGIALSELYISLARQILDLSYFLSLPQKTFDPLSAAVFFAEGYKHAKTSSWKSLLREFYQHRSLRNDKGVAPSVFLLLTQRNPHIPVPYDLMVRALPLKCEGQLATGIMPHVDAWYTVVVIKVSSYMIYHSEEKNMDQRLLHKVVERAYGLAQYLKYPVYIESDIRAESEWEEAIARGPHVKEWIFSGDQRGKILALGQKRWEEVQKEPNAPPSIEEWCWYIRAVALRAWTEGPLL